MWKRKQARRAHLKELDVKFKETKNQQENKTKAVVKIQRKWRKFIKERKEGKQVAYDFAGMVKVIHA